MPLKLIDGFVVLNTGKNTFCGFVLLTEDLENIPEDLALNKIIDWTQVGELMHIEPNW